MTHYFFPRGDGLHSPLGIPFDEQLDGSNILPITQKIALAALREDLEGYSQFYLAVRCSEQTANFDEACHLLDKELLADTPNVGVIGFKIPSNKNLLFYYEVANSEVAHQVRQTFRRFQDEKRRYISFWQEGTGVALFAILRPVARIKEPTAHEILSAQMEILGDS